MMKQHEIVECVFDCVCDHFQCTPSDLMLEKYLHLADGRKCVAAILAIFTDDEYAAEILFYSVYHIKYCRAFLMKHSDKYFKIQKEVNLRYNYA